jgi:hypothetical protein
MGFRRESATRIPMKQASSSIWMYANSNWLDQDGSSSFSISLLFCRLMIEYIQFRLM